MGGLEATGGGGRVGVGAGGVVEAKVRPVFTLK